MLNKNRYMYLTSLVTSLSTESNILCTKLLYLIHFMYSSITPQYLHSLRFDQRFYHVLNVFLFSTFFYVFNVIYSFFQDTLHVCTQL